MIVKVDPHSGIPVFRQLVDQIRFHVASGLLASGDPLPSTRRLSARLGVNPMTVSKAFGLLVEEGVLERRPGRPLVVGPRDEDVLRAGRLDQLAAGMRPLVTMVRQLGLSDDEALELFRRLLEASREESR